MILPDTGEYRHKEAYKRAQLAKLHGVPADSHLICPNDPNRRPDLEKLIVAYVPDAPLPSSDNSSRLYPPLPSPDLAPPVLDQSPSDFIADLRSPRVCNTGPTYTTPNIHLLIEQFHKPDAVTKVDWLALNFVTIKNNELQVRNLLTRIDHLLETQAIKMIDRGKGMHGYDNSYQLVNHDPVTNAVNKVGMVYQCPRNGIMLQLTGVGCGLVREKFTELYDIGRYYEGRISRLDVALDLPAEYNNIRSITVPSLAKNASDGLYDNTFKPSHITPKSRYDGDWGGLVFDGLTHETYDPLKHAPHGLSYYRGSAKSQNELVFYEKGKQLLGDAPEMEAEIDKAWVRIEKRMRRGSSKTEVPLEFMLNPDMAFADNYVGLSDLLSDYAVWLTGQSISVQTIQRQTLKKANDLSLKRAIAHMKRQYGPVAFAMREEGMAYHEIFDAIARKGAVKNYVFDLFDDEDDDYSYSDCLIDEKDDIFADVPF